MYFLPIHWDVEYISRTDNSLITNSIFKTGKPLIVRMIKVNLEIKNIEITNSLIFLPSFLVFNWTELS